MLFRSNATAATLMRTSSSAMAGTGCSFTTARRPCVRRKGRTSASATEAPCSLEVNQYTHVRIVDDDCLHGARDRCHGWKFVEDPQGCVEFDSVVQGLESAGMSVDIMVQYICILIQNRNPQLCQTISRERLVPDVRPGRSIWELLTWAIVVYITAPFF